MDLRKLLVDNYITSTGSGKNYRCNLCLKKNKKGNSVSILIGDLSDTKNHLESYSHQNLLRKLALEDEICSGNSAVFIKLLYCKQCQLYLLNDEEFKCHCLLHFYETNQERIIDTDIVTFNFYEGRKILINCLLCNEELNDEKMLALHLKSDDHINRLNLMSKSRLCKRIEESINYDMNSDLTDLSEFNDKSYIIMGVYCTLCKEEVLESNLIDHLKRKNHNEDKLLNLECRDNAEIKINYICFMCDKAYSNQVLFLKHFYTKEHIYISQNFCKILRNDHFTVVTLEYKGFFYCKICSRYLPNIRTATDHIDGANHCSKVKNIGLNINEVSNASTSVMSPVIRSQDDIPNLILENKSDTKSNTCDNMENLLNELVPLALSKNATRKVHITKSKKNDKKVKPFLQNHFDNNLYSFANLYIGMCIDPGVNNIYSIDLELNTIMNMSYLVKNIWYYAQVFLCSICRKRIEFELDFIIHLLSKAHIKKLNNLKLKNKETKFHSCPICVTYWYGEADEFDEHCAQISHKRCLNSNEFVVPDVSRIVINLLTEVDKNINHLLNESNKTYIVDQERELQLLKSIETVAQVVYPEAKAYMFGSRLSHLGFPDSDVDIFLDCGNVYHNKLCTNNNQSAKYLETVKNLLMVQQNSWTFEEVLSRTRIPILKLIHLDTNLKCDISFVNGLGVEKSKLIRHFNEAYPICRQLILYLKKWLKYCRLLGASGITTYAASWLVIFFLQSEAILPSVHSILETKQTKLVDGWNCSFTDSIPVSTINNLTFNNLLKKLFLFYAAFDYQSNVVCPFVGKFVKKSLFARSSDLPAQMDTYKKRLRSGEIEFFRIDSPLCVHDPVDQSQNMTKAVSKHLLRCFIEYCAASAQYLKS